MKCLVWVALLALVGSTGIAFALAAPSRSKLACAPYLEVVKKNSARVGMKPDIVPGSWGSVPPELQQLPPGAQLCGTVMGMPTIVSPAYGKELETFYAPLFAKVGCQPLTCSVDDGMAQTKCKCNAPKPKRKLGMVVTDTGYEAYTVSLL